MTVQLNLLRDRLLNSTLSEPLEIGTRFLSRTNHISLIIGVQYSYPDKDWRYLLVDEGFVTAPLWVSADQLHHEAIS